MRASRTPITAVRGGQLPRRRRPRWGPVVAGLGLVVTTGACGDIAEQSMCAAYDDYLRAAAAVQDADVESLTADEAEALGQDYLDAVRRLKETADDRHDILLLNLETAARDVVLTLSSVQDDEDYATWAPLVEEDLQWAADAAVAVEDAMETQCPDSGGRS
jgi:hypothetical protein